MKSAIEFATAREVSQVERLVARLKKWAGCMGRPVFNDDGTRLFGVTLGGEDRTDLVEAIGAESGTRVFHLDGEALAHQQVKLPSFKDLTWAFPRETTSHVVLYIRNFGSIGVRRGIPEGTFAIDEIVAQFLTELYMLEKENIVSVFVIVSSDAELDPAFTRTGRLPFLVK